MKLPLYWIDAFTDRPFHGNPAGVVPLASWPVDALMQRIAFENGLSETAFLVRSGPGRHRLRWFTPAAEVDLCGHATLATAFALFHLLGETGEVVTFETRSGLLTVARRGEQMEMDFPSTPPAPQPAAAEKIATAIGVIPVWVGLTRFDLFAELADHDAVATLKPDFPRILALGSRALIVTAAGKDCDFVSRFFAPQVGVPEDPVTGSAHCGLVPYWAGCLGKNRLHARQLSRRGGELLCEFVPAATGDRVKMSGRAVLYLQGEITI